MNAERIQAEAKRADEALRRLAEAVRPENAAAAKVVEGTADYVWSFIRFVLTVDDIEGMFRLPGKEPRS